MPDWLLQAWDTPGLWLVALAAFVGGLVRGFSGFGTAMVFLPLAGQVLPPVGAVLVMLIMDLFGPLPTVPRALRDGHPPDIARLLTGTVIVMPFGLAFLTVMSAETFRSIVAVVSLILLACLIAGLAYRGTLRPRMVYGIGGLSGFLGGAAGVPGPPVILFYMASPLGPAAIRANTTLFLLGFDFLFVSILWLQGGLQFGPMAIGLLMICPVLLGNVLGAAMFRPEWERLYKNVAYAIIAASAISGLPFWG